MSLQPMPTLPYILSKTRCFILTAAMIGTALINAAQIPSGWLMLGDSTARQSHAMIWMEAEGLIGSNAMNIGFFKKIAFGGHIDDGEIQKISNHLRDMNRFGMNSRWGIQCYGFSDSLFEKTNWGLKAMVSSVYSSHLNYSRDLFDVVFKGNALFRGKNAQFSGLSGEYQSFQKFGVGVFNRKNFTGLSVSLVSGQNYQAIDVPHATFYTSPLSDSLMLTYEGSYERADTSKKGWGVGKGIGAAVDFEYNLPLVSGKGWISLALHDVGAVAWNRSREYFRFNDQTTWTGFSNDDLLHFSLDSLSLSGLRDSIHYEVTRKSAWRPLPASAHLRLLYSFSKKGFGEAGLSIWPNRSSLPLLYAGFHHVIGNRLTVGEKISWGGYSLLGIGGEVQWMPRGRWLIRASSNNLLGFFWRDAHAVDGYVTFAFLLKKISPQISQNNNE